MERDGGPYAPEFSGYKRLGRRISLFQCVFSFASEVASTMRVDANQLCGGR
jgi:hypothetical protein